MNSLRRSLRVVLWGAVADGLGKVGDLLWELRRHALKRLWSAEDDS